MKVLEVCREVRGALEEDVAGQRIEQGPRMGKVVGEGGLRCLIVLAGVAQDPVLVVVEMAQAQWRLDRAAAVVPAAGRGVEAVLGEQLPAGGGDEIDGLHDI